jgi:spore coat protein CotH
VVLVGVCACWGALAGTAAAASPADWMYEPTTFTEVRLTLPPASYKTLEEHPEDEYVPGTFSIAETNGTPGHIGSFSTPIEVGIRLKGSIGSLRSINEKAAFKIKFDGVVEGQTFDGLEKLTLNNMVQDPSMIHETMAYAAFHEMGVYAPHTGFTYLWINGKSYGLHLNIETQDQVALEKQFGPFQSPPQHLYEGEYGADVSSTTNPMTGHKRWEDLEVDEGKKKEKGDLAALLGAVEGTTGAFSERVAPYADLPEMTRMWMTEKYIGHWDGYSGTPEGEYQPNNYYLYSNPAGVFQILPWGTDQTWAQHLSFEGAGGVLFNDCIADTAGCRPLYREAGTEALAKLTASEFSSLARCTTADVLPWREYEAKTSEAQKLPPATVAQSKEAQAEAKKFAEQRPAQLASFLGLSVPAPPGDTPACAPLRPIGGFPPPPVPPATPGATPATSAPAAGAPAPSVSSSPAKLALASRSASGGGLRLELEAPAAGGLQVHATFGPRGRGGTACRGRSDVAAAGRATVDCRFTAAFRRRLGERPARINLVATLLTPSGASLVGQQGLSLAKR